MNQQQALHICVKKSCLLAGTQYSQLLLAGIDSHKGEFWHGHFTLAFQKGPQVRYAHDTHVRKDLVCYGELSETIFMVVESVVAYSSSSRISVQTLFLGWLIQLPILGLERFDVVRIRESITLRGHHHESMQFEELVKIH